MNVSTGRKLKQLLAIIAKSVPFKPNMTSIATALSASRNNITDYCLFVEEAGMIAQLRDSTGGIRGLGKVDKIYLDNTNLIYSLANDNSNAGNIRETFFLNQLRVKYDVMVSPIADFLIGDYTFEVGGKNKGMKQIQGMDKAFIVKDDIELGYLNTIPLWQFGLTYWLWKAFYFHFPIWRHFTSRFGLVLLPDLANTNWDDNNQSSQPNETIYKNLHKHQFKHYMIVYVSNAGQNCIFTSNDWNIDSQNKLVPSVSYLYHEFIISWFTLMFIFEEVTNGIIKLFNEIAKFCFIKMLL